MSELVPGKTVATLASDTANARELNTERDSDNAQDEQPQLKEVFASLVKVLKEQGLSSEELMDIYQGPAATPDKQHVPLGIFSGKLSPSESLCKYLKENLSLSYKEISDAINRDERSIWTSHRRAVSKMPEAFSDETLKSSRPIPIAIFANRGLSVLENLVMYLKGHGGGTNYHIAKLLNKTPSMVYTIYNRAKGKLEKQSRHSPISQDASLVPTQSGGSSLEKKSAPKKTQKRASKEKVPKKRSERSHSPSEPKAKPEAKLKRKRLNIRDYI